MQHHHSQCSWYFIVIAFVESFFFCITNNDLTKRWHVILTVAALCHVSNFILISFGLVYVTIIVILIFCDNVVVPLLQINSQRQHDNFITMCYIYFYQLTRTRIYISWNKTSSIQFTQKCLCMTCTAPHVCREGCLTLSSRNCTAEPFLFTRFISPVEPHSVRQTKNHNARCIFIGKLFNSKIKKKIIVGFWCKYYELVVTDDWIHGSDLYF